MNLKQCLVFLSVGFGAGCFTDLGGTKIDKGDMAGSNNGDVDMAVSTTDDGGGGGDVDLKGVTLDLKGGGSGDLANASCELPYIAPVSQAFPHLRGNPRQREGASNSPADLPGLERSPNANLLPGDPGARGSRLGFSARPLKPERHPGRPGGETSAQDALCGAGRPLADPRSKYLVLQKIFRIPVRRTQG